MGRKYLFNVEKLRSKRQIFIDQEVMTNNVTLLYECDVI